MSERGAAAAAADFSTIEVARLLGLSVRSVQLMVDRGELTAWKTSGGHRRIAGASVDRWRQAHGHGAEGPGHSRRVAKPKPKPAGFTVLLIDDSVHFQNLVSLLVRRQFPNVDLHVANDGISGLALYGQLRPDALIVDILLPGIDGATLITSLRSHPQFAESRLAVVTSLEPAERAPYAFALEQVPVIHKPRLVADLPLLLAGWVPATRKRVGAAPQSDR